MPLVFDDQPQKPKLVFDEPNTPLGFAKNIGTNAVELGKSLAHGVGMVADPLGITESLMTGSMQPMKDKPMANLNMLKSIPGGIIDEGKRIGIGTAFTEGPVAGAKQFGQAFYDKPLSTAIDVAPLAMPIGKAMGLRRAAAPAAVAEEAIGLSAAPEAAAPATAGFRSAIKLRGKTHIGEPGDMHPDVIRRMAEAEGVPESQMLDTVSKIGDQGFTQGEKFLSRAEASAAAGGARPEAASLMAEGKMEMPLPNRMTPPGSPAQIAPEAQGILNKPPAPPAPAAGAAEATVPMGATFQDTVANLKRQIPDAVQKPLEQVHDFVNQKFGKAAEKPGFGDIAGDAMIRKAQGMRFRELGGTPGQARVITDKIGEEGLRELMDVAKDKGITRSPLGFQRRAATKALEESAGRAIGGIRKIAAERGAVHNPKAIVKAIRAELDSKYLGKGSASGEKGAYLKALEDIKASGGRADKMAEAITDLNSYATKNKMTQAAGARTDVANAASRINNQMIKSKLGPKEVEFYEESLRDFGASKIFKKLQKFEVGREMGGRAGVGGLWRNIKQGAMDLGGNKVMEGVYEKLGSRFKSGKINNLASLSEGAIDDLLSSLDDAIDEIGGK